MRALANQGNVAEALSVYSRLCDLLRDELGVSPSEATRAAHHELVLRVQPSPTEPNPLVAATSPRATANSDEETFPHGARA